MSDTTSDRRQTEARTTPSAPALEATFPRRDEEFANSFTGDEAAFKNALPEDSRNVNDIRF